MPEWITEQVLLSIIGGVFALLTAIVTKLSFDMGRTKKDAAAARQAAVKTEHSINNRPTPLSDRLDAVQKSLDKVASVLEEHGQKLTTHTKDLRGIDESVGILRAADRDLQTGLASTRRELNAHIEDTSEWTPMLRDLHQQYHGKTRNIDQ